MEVCCSGPGLVTNNRCDLNNFTDCILCHRLTVGSSGSKSFFYFELGPLDSLGHFIMFSTFYFIGKILSWSD